MAQLSEEVPVGAGFRYTTTVVTNTAEVNDALVARLAQLARLELSSEERAQLVRELGRIVEYVGQLEELSLDDVPPLTAPTLEGGASLRPDVPIPSLDRELALREAPRALEDGFGVPGFVDEG